MSHILKYVCLAYTFELNESVTEQKVPVAAVQKSKLWQQEFASK